MAVHGFDADEGITMYVAQMRTFELEVPAILLNNLFHATVC